MHVLFQRAAAGIANFIMESGNTVCGQLGHRLDLQAGEILRLIQGFENLTLPFGIDSHFCSLLFGEFL
ncbi:hypothetical protein D3C86_1927790 [compost metagenome]